MRKRRTHQKKKTQQPSSSRNLEFFLNVISAEPHKITQKELSDLIRDLELLKNKAELLYSMKVTAFRSHQEDFEQFFTIQGELSACKNVECLMAAVNIRYNLEEWQLFIDSCMRTLKAILLHKVNPCCLCHPQTGNI
jgi:hypothetical protein